MTKKYWLMKTEPNTYSIDDFKEQGKTHWEGVRNYQARNFMKSMKKGDLVLFYHSVETPPGVTGIAEVCKEAYADHTQFDRRSRYYDPKASDEKVIWEMVDVKFINKFPDKVTLSALKANPKLREMPVVKPFQRLSVMPISKEQFLEVKKMGQI